MSFIESTLNILFRFWPTFLSGIWTTLWLSAVTVAGGTLIGALVAFVRIKKIPVVQQFLGFYVSLFRGTPLLTQLLIFNAALSAVLIKQGIRIEPVYWCILTMILNSGAYVSEIFRAGIQAVDKGQSEAAKSLGMSDNNMLMRIIYPQAIKNIIPALGNEFVTMIKETSLVSVYFIGDIMTVITNIKTLTYSIMEPAIIALFVYYFMTSIASFGLSILEKRLAVSD